jgi:hypothetical protein
MALRLVESVTWLGLAPGLAAFAEEPDGNPRQLAPTGLLNLGAIWWAQRSELRRGCVSSAGLGVARLSWRPGERFWSETGGRPARTVKRWQS